MNKHIANLIKETDDSELRKLLLALIEALTGESDISKRIEKLLDSAIAFYDSDRAYIIEGDTELITGVNTHERCAPGIESQQDTLKDMPTDVYLHWLGIFRRFEEITIPDMDAIKECRPNEYKYFNDSDVHSIIVVPFSKRISQGFVGVDNPKKHITDTVPLRILSYAVVLELNELKLTKEKNALMQVSQYPEMFVRVHLLGRLQVTAHGGTVYQEQFTAQGQALLTIMLLNPHRTFSPGDLFDIISQDKESDNLSSVVSNAIYRLRSSLDIVGLKELIVFDRGSYSLNQRFQIETDAERFLQFFFAIKKADNPDDKLEKCLDALRLYKSPLPETLCSGLRWVIECADMNAKFLAIVQEAVNLHLERNDFGNAHEIAKHALKIDPQEPEMMLLMAKVMKKSEEPGLRLYARKIMPYLDTHEKEQLQHILEMGK